MPKVTNSNVYRARWTMQHDADEGEFGMGEPEMDWRGQAGPLRVFKSHGKKERKEEGRLGRHHPLAKLISLRLWF